MSLTRKKGPNNPNMAIVASTAFLLLNLGTEKPEEKARRELAEANSKKAAKLAMQAGFNEVKSCQTHLNEQPVPKEQPRNHVHQPAYSGGKRPGRGSRGN